MGDRLEREAVLVAGERLGRQRGPVQPPVGSEHIGPEPLDDRRQRRLTGLDHPTRDDIAVDDDRATFREQLGHRRLPGADSSRQAHEQHGRGSYGKALLLRISGGRMLRPSPCRRPPAVSEDLRSAARISAESPVRPVQVDHLYVGFCRLEEGTLAQTRTQLQSPTASPPRPAGRGRLEELSRAKESRNTRLGPQPRSSFRHRARPPRPARHLPAVGQPRGRGRARSHHRRPDRPHAADRDRRAVRQHRLPHRASLAPATGHLARRGAVARGPRPPRLAHHADR